MAHAGRAGRDRRATRRRIEAPGPRRRDWERSVLDHENQLQTVRRARSARSALGTSARDRDRSPRSRRTWWLAQFRRPFPPAFSSRRRTDRTVDSLYGHGLDTVRPGKPRCDLVRDPCGTLLRSLLVRLTVPVDQPRQDLLCIVSRLITLPPAAERWHQRTRLCHSIF